MNMGCFLLSPKLFHNVDVSFTVAAGLLSLAVAAPLGKGFHAS